jgi:hypothetical protein
MVFFQLKMVMMQVTHDRNPNEIRKNAYTIISDVKSPDSFNVLTLLALY